MEEASRKIEEQGTTIRTIVLIFIGAGVNLTVGYVTLLSALNALISSPTKTLMSNIPQTAIIFALLYFVVGILYSTSASLAFKPKRIISPLFTQLLAASFVPILVYYVISITEPQMSLATGAGVAFVVFMMALGIFGAAGLGQERVVKLLVGLNGTKDDVNSFSLLVDGKLSDVIKVLKKPDVREALEIDKRYDKRPSKHSYVFRTPDYHSRQLFIALMADSNNAKTQLSTVSYTQTRYWIQKTGSIKEKQRISTLEDVLRGAGLTFNPDTTNSPAKLIAYNHGLGVTEPKLLGLKNVSNSSKAILGCLAVLIGVVTLLWKTGYMNPDTYETFVVLAGLSILVDFLPLVKIKRRELDLDDLE
jgi:hypothetical protein